MKSYLFILLFSFSLIGFAQDNHIVKTDDGRRVLLKADFTWEYIDAKAPEENAIEAAVAKNENACQITADYEEPKLNGKIQAQLKKGRATIDHVKEKVASDYECQASDVLLLWVKEQKSKAVYMFCANGTKVKYKRMGNSIIEAGKFF
ncbi:DUF3157 family protein [Tamlana sp. 2_MG-2023]|uniref:DUF3157 family protein n=1 Tax=unclassified Tamlana TaxID=2614803 RepID=UPI0026E3EFCB|nr:MULTISPECIES: DUF3157 family protein [unclassified Tamlana]MDO6761095.1 DUF3157 family protein [Tamlana sp. 2_MG-2023]MDO6791572.1 DUF3157 family protein [Tamlana sp. 1_MG-2023]